MKMTLLLICLLLTSAACADTFEIPLPGLTDDFDSGFAPPNEAPSMRSVTFTIPPEIVSISQLILTMSGTSSEGFVIREIDIGEGQTIVDTLAVTPDMRLILTAEPLGDDCFFGIVNLTTLIFTDETGMIGGCDGGNPPDPDLLLNTTIGAELHCTFSEPGYVWIDPLATLTDVSVIVVGQTVAAEARAWGGIKALYR